MNQETFNQIVSEAKAKAANHPEWLRAIEKAAKMLASGELVVTLFADDTALVTSPNGSYRVNGCCPCAAKTAHCYHRAAKRIWALYEEAACKAALPVEFRSDVATTPRQTLIVEIKACWPKTWPPMGQELLARFGKSMLEMLDTDMLRRVRMAIAA